MNVGSFHTCVDSRHLKQHIQFGHPRYINQAISLAIEFEAFQQTNGDRVQTFKVIIVQTKIQTQRYVIVFSSRKRDT